MRKTNRYFIAIILTLLMSALVGCSRYSYYFFANKRTTPIQIEYFIGTPKAGEGDKGKSCMLYGYKSHRPFLYQLKGKRKIRRGEFGFAPEDRYTWNASTCSISLRLNPNEGVLLDQVSLLGDVESDFEIRKLNIIDNGNIVSYVFPELLNEFNYTPKKNLNMFVYKE